MEKMKRRTVWIIGGLLFLTAPKAGGQENRILPGRIQQIIDRPEFAKARWGMSFYYPDTKETAYTLSSSELFRPASAVKVFTEAAMFSALGPDYRFRTPVYRTGPIEGGVLKGDLVLVASGDLLLGGRM